MKEHASILAMTCSLALVLLALIVLVTLGLKSESPVLLGLVSAASGIAGAIGGFSMNNSPEKTKPPNEPAPQGQREGQQ